MKISRPCSDSISGLPRGTSTEGKMCWNSAKPALGVNKRSAFDPIGQGPSEKYRATAPLGTGLANTREKVIIFPDMKSTDRIQ